MLRIRRAFALARCSRCRTTAGTTVAPAQVAGFACRFVMIPMRDGVRLNTSVCEPKGTHRAGADSHHAHALWRRRRHGGSHRLPLSRGRRLRVRLPGHSRAVQERRPVLHESPAACSRPIPRARTRAPIPTTRSTWLLKNVAGNNGRVGVLGVSYPGFLATMAGINPHPAVKAISPQAPMTDTWMGDDFFHQGAFRSVLRLRVRGRAWS